MTRNTHRSLNLPVPAEMVDYLSGQPEFVRREQRSFLRLLPKELREPNLTNLSAGEFLAEMNAAVLLQGLDLHWDHPLRKQVVGAVQEADWYNKIVPKHGQRMVDLVSFLRWNMGLQRGIRCLAALSPFVSSRGCRSDAAQGQAGQEHPAGQQP